MAQVGIIPTISLTLSLAEARLLVKLLNEIEGGYEFADAIDNTIKQFEPPKEDKQLELQLEEPGASESDDPPKAA